MNIAYNTGQYLGFKIDAVKRLASDMAVEVEFVPTVWITIILSLMTHKFDIIIRGMNMPPENFNSPKIRISVHLGTTAENAVNN